MIQEFKHLLGCLGVVYKTISFVFDLSASHVQFCTFVKRKKDDDEDFGLGKFFFGGKHSFGIQVIHFSYIVQ